MKTITVYSIGHGRHTPRYFVALFILSSICFFGFQSNDSISKNFSAKFTPTATPTPESFGDSVGILLDKENIYSRCPPGGRPVPSYDSGMIIKVITISNFQNDSLLYDYTISGGSIVGAGAKVSWDLTGAQPGTYTISVKVKDKSTSKETTTAKLVTVQDGGCIADCECPLLSVDSPASPTQTGDTMIFTANVSGGSGVNVTYNWTISDGEIIEGQGTPIIKVATNSKMAGKTVTATIEINGVCNVCPKTETGTGKVAAKKRKDKQF